MQVGIKLKVYPCDTLGIIAACKTEPLFLYGPIISETYSCLGFPVISSNRYHECVRRLKVT